jgi:hypothetical protein
MTVAENMSFALKIDDRRKEEISARVARLSRSSTLDSISTADHASATSCGVGGRVRGAPAHRRGCGCSRATSRRLRLLGWSIMWSLSRRATGGRARIGSSAVCRLCLPSRAGGLSGAAGGRPRWCGAAEAQRWCGNGGPGCRVPAHRSPRRCTRASTSGAVNTRSEGCRQRLTSPQSSGVDTVGRSRARSA